MTIMQSCLHPSSLNALKRYRQANSILRHTSRAVNPAWYRPALEQQFQLHIRPSGSRIDAFFYNAKTKQWLPGPALTEEFLANPSQLESLANDAISQAKNASANSLGIVLHIADEFSTAEIKPELANPASLPELRETAIHNPEAILQDTSISPDQASWRILPYPASITEPIATTITFSRQRDALLEAFRLAGQTANFPVITRALSAPFVALLGLSRLVRPSSGKPFVAILQYPWFTTMAFFNEHADLRFLRTLQHRTSLRPANLQIAISTTCASLEFIQPDIYILPLGPDVDSSLAGNLQPAFLSSNIEIFSPSLSQQIPAWAPELALSLPLASDSVPTLSSHTLVSFRTEKWALQDFLPIQKHLAEIYPSRSEMQLLRALRFVRVALFLFALLAIAFFASKIFSLSSSPEWAFDNQQATNTRQRLANLNLQRQKLDYWSNLLEDRSKAWTAMESLSRMFPANQGTLLKTYSHTVKPEITPNQTKVGFIKEWRIAGFANDQALEYLNALNTRESITAHFEEISNATGSTAFKPNIGNRGITTNIRTLENSAYKPTAETAQPTDESSYPFTFELTISQRFEASDPLAIISTKAP